MHELLLDDLVKSVLQERKFGLAPATITHYRQTYKRLKQYAAAKNVGDSRSERHRGTEAGAIGRGRRGHLRRASLILYVTNGSIRWATYTFDRQPMPESQIFCPARASWTTLEQSADSVMESELLFRESAATVLLSSTICSPHTVPQVFVPSEHSFWTTGCQQRLAASETSRSYRSFRIRPMHWKSSCRAVIRRDKAIIRWRCETGLRSVDIRASNSHT